MSFAYSHFERHLFLLLFIPSVSSFLLDTSPCFKGRQKKTLDFRRQTLDVEIYSLYKPLIINKTISFLQSLSQLR